MTCNLCTFWNLYNYLLLYNEINTLRINTFYKKKKLYEQICC